MRYRDYLTSSWKQPYRKLYQIKPSPSMLNSTIQEGSFPCWSTDRSSSTSTKRAFLGSQASPLTSPPSGTACLGWSSCELNLGSSLVLDISWWSQINVARVSSSFAQGFDLICSCHRSFNGKGHLQDWTSCSMKSCSSVECSFDQIL